MHVNVPEQHVSGEARRNTDASGTLATNDTLMADIRNLRQFPIFQSPIMSSTAAAGSSSRPASNSDNACTAGMGNGTNGSKHPGTQNRANVNTNHQSGQMGAKQQQAPNRG